MVVGKDQVDSALEVAAESTLEVAPQRPQYQADPHWKPLPSDPGKQVAQDFGLEFAAKENIYQQEINVPRVPAQRLWTRTRIMSSIAIGLIIILAAVLGGVFGSRHKRSATASPTSPSNSSATSPFVTPTQRNIAAVSFTSNSANNTRVYFQDDVGQITEASNSAVNTTWGVKKTGFGGKNGSAIAAAVSRPSLPLEISVFYLDVNNLIHDITYNNSTSSWTSGILSAQGYTVMPNSSLSAMYDSCSLCANTTLIAFQDENGFVQIGNLTSDGWTLTQLGQQLEPELGTGLALLPVYHSNLKDQINLYYQKSSLNLALAALYPASGRNGVDGWGLNAQIWDPIPSGSPISAACSYSNLSTIYETWIEVLSLSTTGVEVNNFSGARNQWYKEHPSAMANSTSNTKTYESVAVTATGNAFAVVKQDGQTDVIKNWQVAPDMIDWSLVGNVNLNGVWG